MALRMSDPPRLGPASRARPGAGRRVKCTASSPSRALQLEFVQAQSCRACKIRCAPPTERVRGTGESDTWPRPPRGSVSRARRESMMLLLGCGVGRFGGVAALENPSVLTAQLRSVGPAGPAARPLSPSVAASWQPSAARPRPRHVRLTPPESADASAAGTGCAEEGGMRETPSLALRLLNRRI